MPGTLYYVVLLTALAPLAARHLPFNLPFPTLASFLLAQTCLILWSSIYSRFLSPLRTIPRAKPDWSTFLYRWLYTNPTPLVLAQYVRDTPNDGLLQYTGIGGSTQILVTKPEALKEVFVSQAYTVYERPLIVRQRIAAVTGQGLLAVAGDHHKLQRKNVMPAFAYRTIKDMTPTFWAKACELSNRFQEMIIVESGDSDNGTVVDILKWSSRSALDVIGIAVWGSDFQALQNPQSKLIEKYEKVFSNSNQIFMDIALALPMKLLSKLPLKRNKEIREGMGAMRKRALEVIAQKKADNAKCAHEGKDILSISMRSGLFDDKSLVDMMLTMLSAGHDTVAVTLAWACYLLAKNEDVQHRLRQEVRSKLPSPSSSEPVNTDMIESCSYLQAVVNEVLRLTPAPSFNRRTNEKDTVLLGHKLPRGSDLVSTPWITNRNDWADGDEFQPERWLKPGNEKNGGMANAFDYATFSHGPRTCPGQGFARAELHSLLSCLIGRFRITLADPNYKPQIVFSIVAKPMPDILVKLEDVGAW